MRRDKNTFPYIQRITADVEKTCFSIDKLNYNISLTHNQWRCEMKSYDKLKAEIEAIQQQMVEAKKNERAHALKGGLVEGRKKQ